MDQNIIKSYQFDESNNMLMLPVKKTEYLTRPERLNDGRFWQEQFGFYGHMPINKKGKFVINTIKGSPLVWKKEQGCIWTPAGSMEFGKTEITPEAMQLQMELCDDEILNSCFETYHEYRNGRRTAAEFQEMLEDLTEEINYNAIEGLYFTSAAGNYFDLDNLKFAEGTSAKVQKDFRDAVKAATGWMIQMKNLAASGKAPNLNVPGVFKADDFDTNGEYTGDLIELFDTLRSAASKKLKRAMTRGQTRTRKGLLMPLMPVSDNVYQAVCATYEKMGQQQAQNLMQMTKREVPFMGATKDVYYIKNTPIVPLDEVNGFSEYLKTDIAFAGIVMSGMVQIGTSYDDLMIPMEADANGNGQSAGLAIQDLGASDLRNLDKTVILARNLHAVAFADTDFAVCAFQDIEA